MRYATEDDAWGKRDGTLYILAGDFDIRGTFGDDSRVGGALGNLRRTLTDALETLRHDGMPPLAAYLVALAVGLGVVAWTSARAGRPHKAVIPRFVRRLRAGGAGRGGGARRDSRRAGHVAHAGDAGDEERARRGRCRRDWGWTRPRRTTSSSSASAPRGCSTRVT